jgi:iron-sulfur cluster repair protein YtfE (RIC family)
MEIAQQNSTVLKDVRTMLIRDLVERYPTAMPALSQFGIDVCCGGSLTVVDAAKAHGHEPDVVIQTVASSVIEKAG